VRERANPPTPERAARGEEDPRHHHRASVCHSKSSSGRPTAQQIWSSRRARNYPTDLRTGPWQQESSCTHGVRMRVNYVVVVTAGLLPLASTALTPRTIPNFRDIGGTATAAGRTIRSGILHRCASPANVSATDADVVLNQLGVRTVLDLRGEHDALKDGGPRRLAPATKYLPLMTEGMLRKALLKRARAQGMGRFATILALSVSAKVSPSRRLKSWLAELLDLRLARLLNTVSLDDLYWLICSERGEQLREAAELCASGESLPVMIHCTHGKDRTGVLTAMLLAAVDVPEEDIIADYTRSHDFGCSVEGQWAMRQALPSRVRQYVREDVLGAWCEADEDTMAKLFRRVREEHGSVAAYLDTIGVDAELRKRLVEQLTQPC
jgi:protein-tyrosine phosphatase